MLPASKIIYFKFEKNLPYERKNLSYERLFENEFLETEAFPELLVVTR